MRIYLAGPSAELERVRTAAAFIESEGHTLTVRWWDVIEADRQGRPTDDGTSDEVLAHAWDVNAWAGVGGADWIVVLAKSEGGLSNGAREEVAFSMAHHVPVRVVGDVGSSPLCGWLRHNGYVVATLEEALR